MHSTKTATTMAGHHHGERELRRAEGEGTEAVQGGLQGHHGKARQQCDRGPGDEARHRLGLHGLREIGCDARSATLEAKEARGREQIHAAHRQDHAIQTQQGHQEEAPGEGAREGTECVGAVDPGVDAGRVFEVAREGQGEDRDRAPHQHGRRTDQQGRERHVESEAQRVVVDGAEK
jgi:hypothetical protein